MPDTKGRILENVADLTGTIGVFIVAGQSMGSNSVDAPHSIVNVGRVHNLNIIDGGLYAMQDPLLGTDIGAGNLGNLFTRVADGLVTAGVYDHVVMVPTSVGGTTVAEWSAVYYTSIIVAYRRLKSIGLAPSAILWQQGESDNAIGTTSVDYESTFLTMASKVDGAGIDAPWFIAKSTYYLGNSSAALRLAIDAIVAGSPNYHPGADTDAVTSRQADGTHLTGPGADAAAALWVSAIDAVY